MSNSSKYFRRSYEITISDILIRDSLQVSFDIFKSDRASANTANIVIHNLAHRNRQALTEIGETVPRLIRRLAGTSEGTTTSAVFPAVEIKAGYQNRSELLYKGRIRSLHVMRDETEWITRIESGDGEQEIRRVRLNKSWNKKTPYTRVITQLANALGLDRGRIVEKYNSVAPGKTVGRAFTVEGLAYPALEDIFKSVKMQLSVQDGTLQVLKRTEVTSEPPILLSPSTGMLGAPAAGDEGIVEVSSLLNGGYRPGRQVRLESVSNLKGNYKVKTARHLGDYRGDTWVSELELLPI